MARGAGGGGQGRGRAARGDAPHRKRAATSCRFTIPRDQVSLLAPVGTRNLISFQAGAADQLQPDPCPLPLPLPPPGAERWAAGGEGLARGSWVPIPRPWVAP